MFAALLAGAAAIGGVPVAGLAQEKPQYGFACQLVSKATVEGEPWFLAVCMNLAPPFEPLADDAYGSWTVERLASSGQWQPKASGAWDPDHVPSLGQKPVRRAGADVFDELCIADPNVVFTPGTYRVRVAAQNVTSEWLTVEVAAHAGNRLAFQDEASKRSWYFATQMRERLVLALGEQTLKQGLGEDRRYREHIAAVCRKQGISETLVAFGQLQLARLSISDATNEQDAALRQKQLQAAKTILAAIRVDGFVGPTGGLAAEVMRTKAKVAWQLHLRAETAAINEKLRAAYPGAR